MAIDLIYLLEVLFIPLTALLAPWALAGLKWRKSNVKPLLSRSQAVKIAALSPIFSLFIFSALIFLTGGISSYFFLEEGLITVSDREIAWNATKHLRILIPFFPGTSFLVVAVLTGIFYAGLLTFPPHCAMPRTDNKSNTTSTTMATSKKVGMGATSASTTSSVVASVSALASGAVCCTTSVIALVAPTVGALLAPISPFLIVISLVILDLSTWRYLIPRIPTVNAL